MRQLQYAIAFVILLAAVAVNRRFDQLVVLAATRSETDRKSFSEFPPVVGKWRAETEELSERQLELLACDDWLRADFTDPAGELVSVYVGYYTNPDRATQHPPTICYPGAGWREIHEGSAVLHVPGLERGLPVTVTIFERDGQREMVVYWYSLSGYTASNATWQKIARLRSILAGRPIAGASKIQVAINVETTRENAQIMLEEFLGEFIPVLETLIPQQYTNGG